MGTNPKETATGNAIRKFARTLLATTCLTAASSGVVVASTITYNEGTSLTTFPPVTDLAAAAIPGTTIVNASESGQMTEFELSALGIGTFTLDLAIDTANNLGDTISVFSDSSFSASSLIESGSASSTLSPGPLGLASIPIPTSGNLFIQTKPNSESSNSFTVTVNTQGAPEPSTIAMAGLGLATLITLSRKKR